MVQDYSINPIRSSAVLTNSYVAGTVLGVSNTPPDPSLRNQLVLYINFTLGNLTSAQVKVEFSNDNVTYYQECFSSIAAGVDTLSLGAHTLNATGKYRLAIPIKDRFIKVSAQGTGDVTNSLMDIQGIVGIA